MRGRGREINVFSISALDLFASALGAFILISIVLMPYFLRVDREVVERIRQELEQTTAELEATHRQLAQALDELQQCRQREAACLQEVAHLRGEVERLQGELRRAQSASEQAQDELRQCQEDLHACKEKLSKTFLAIVIKWSTEQHDVDLHVIDAAGKEFSYRTRTIPGRPGELSVDTENGPGVEIWEVPVAPAGEYQVLYTFFRRHDNPDAATVLGGVYFRDGHTKLRKRDLTELKRANAVLVAIITVKDDGTVEIAER